MPSWSLAFPGEVNLSLFKLPLGFPLFQVGERGFNLFFWLVFVGEEEKGALFAGLGVEHVLQEGRGLAFGQVLNGFEGGVLTIEVAFVFVGQCVEPGGIGGNAFWLFFDLLCGGDFELFEFFVGEL